MDYKNLLIEVIAELDSVSQRKTVKNRNVKEEDKLGLKIGDRVTVMDPRSMGGRLNPEHVDTVTGFYELGGLVYLEGKNQSGFKHSELVKDYIKIEDSYAELAEVFNA